MKTIKELTNQINAELHKLYSDYYWAEFEACEYGDKELYGKHISLAFYYINGKSIKATLKLRKKVTNIFKKYYSRQAKFYKARHISCPSGSDRDRMMLDITILT